MEVTQLLGSYESDDIELLFTLDSCEFDDRAFRTDSVEELYEKPHNMIVSLLSRECRGAAV